MTQPNVLVVCDDAEFAQALLARWQWERAIPSFTQVESDSLNGPAAPECDLALVGPVRAGRQIPVLKALEASGRSVVCLVSPPTEMIRQMFPRILFIVGPVSEDVIVLIAVETLRRLEATARARRAEQTVAKLNHHAALGKYMLEVRHGLNNALTSVLGNSELLLMNADSYETQAREQLETIHTMSLRIHETMFRFSSLENEMQFAEKQSHSEISAIGVNSAAGD